MWQMFEKSVLLLFIYWMAMNTNSLEVRRTSFLDCLSWIGRLKRWGARYQLYIIENIGSTKTKTMRINRKTRQTRYAICEFRGFSNIMSVNELEIWNLLPQRLNILIQTLLQNYSSDSAAARKLIDKSLLCFGK